MTDKSTPRTDAIKKMLHKKYPDSLMGTHKLLYYMEAAECFGQECALLERELADCRVELERMKNPKVHDVDEFYKDDPSPSPAGPDALAEALDAWMKWYPDCAQLLDGWHADIAWTEWDESVRKRLMELGTLTLAALRSRPAQGDGELLAFDASRQEARLALVKQLRTMSGINPSSKDAVVQAAELIEQLLNRPTVPIEILKALVNHNDNARSFFEISQRIATEFGTHELGTNFGAFAETTHNMLKRWHEVTNEARAAIDAAMSQQEKRDG